MSEIRRNSRVNQTIKIFYNKCKKKIPLKIISQCLVIRMIPSQCISSVVNSLNIFLLVSEISVQHRIHFIMISLIVRYVQYSNLLFENIFVRVLSISVFMNSVPKKKKQIDKFHIAATDIRNKILQIALNLLISYTVALWVVIETKFNKILLPEIKSKPKKKHNNRYCGHLMVPMLFTLQSNICVCLYALFACVLTSSACLNL